MGLTDRAVTVCEDQGLQSNTNYKFRVRETCEVGEPSPPGESAEWISTLAVGASPPTGVRAAEATPSSLEVFWAAPDSMGDCSFLRWRVEQREVGGEFVAAGGGCGAWMLTSECVVSCVAEDLQSNTDYEFRVRLECTNMEASDFSSVSAAAKTLPVAASPPTSMETGVVLDEAGRHVGGARVEAVASGGGGG